jgi:aromatic ring-opening dioxygenase catalytic subunit (LigB family)
MYPKADIPSLQLSLLRGLNSSSHIALGKALREIRNENILVIGSGFSFHNMQGFSWRGEGATDPENEAFQDWLIDVCTNNLDETEEKTPFEQEIVKKDSLESMLEKQSRNQIRSDYRRSLGSESRRRYME